MTETNDKTKTKNGFAGLLLAALLGGAIATGGGLLLDDGDTATTTVVRQAPLSAGAAKQDGDGAGLTAADIYKRTSPGVVFIRAQVVRQVETPFDIYPQQQQSEATGTGFVIDADGSILTNAHVVAGATNVRVQLSDKRTVPAKVLGQDLSTDIALLQVEPKGLNLKVLPLGSAKDVRVGDPTIAIGNPFGLDRTLTTGVVSALAREIRAPNGFTINDVIQTDAAINPGNSGGPLLDATGRVIGINSQIETAGGGRGSIGIGFAVPIDTAKRIVPDLRSKGRVERAYLGVSGVTIDGRLDALDLPVDEGVLVQTVERGSPADKAGLRAGDITAQVDGAPVILGGDIIVSAGGKAVASQDELISAIGGRKSGEEVELGILRDGKKRTLKARLAKRPTGPTG